MDIPALDGELAWFLDIDGCLLEIAQSPTDVTVPPGLTQSLARLRSHAQEALALISGRSITEVDALFTPEIFCVAGQHGLERRDIRGKLWHADVDQPAFEDARRELRTFATAHPGVILEDKGLTFALHYRKAPHLEGLAVAIMTKIRDHLGANYHLQAGKFVLEVKRRDYSKATAIATFLCDPPFCNRRAVFIGDDLTDEDGFRFVNDRGGISIHVGCTEATVARHRLPSVHAVHALLRSQTEPARGIA